MLPPHPAEAEDLYPDEAEAEVQEEDEEDEEDEDEEEQEEEEEEEEEEEGGGKSGWLIFSPPTPPRHQSSHCRPGSIFPIPQPLTVSEGAVITYEKMKGGEEHLVW